VAVDLLRAAAEDRGSARQAGGDVLLAPRDERAESGAAGKHGLQTAAEHGDVARQPAHALLLAAADNAATGRAAGSDILIAEDLRAEIGAAGGDELGAQTANGRPDGETTGRNRLESGRVENRAAGGAAGEDQLDARTALAVQCRAAGIAEHDLLAAGGQRARIGTAAIDGLAAVAVNDRREGGAAGENFERVAAGDDDARADDARGHD